MGWWEKTTGLGGRRTWSRQRHHDARAPQQEHQDDGKSQPRQFVIRPAGAAQFANRIQFYFRVLYPVGVRRGGVRRVGKMHCRFLVVAVQTKVQVRRCNLHEQ